MKSILQYRDLIDISVVESEEPLMVVQGAVQEIICRYEKTDMVPYLGDAFMLREGAIARLKKAARILHTLDATYALHLVYGYRHPEVQKSYFENQKAQLARQHPSLAEADLVARTHLLTASPDVAGHPTGGAIDITIDGPQGPLDMGCGIADFTSDKIETFANNLTDTQRANRELLRRIMLDVGFAPFDGEWWHFSYGDREWAAYYQQPHAIYEQIAFGTKK